MGGVVGVCLPYLPGGYLLQAVLSVLIGAAMYAIATVVLLSEETRFVISRLTGKNRTDEVS
jgi:hypothetical protein